MIVYLLMQRFGYSEICVLSVLKSRGSTQAMVSIGERAAQRALETHNKMCVEIGMADCQLDESHYSYFTIETELLE